MTIGSRLRAERSRLGLSQTDFAALCGVAKNTQLNYEKDERSPDAAYLLAAGQAGVDVHFVIFGSTADGQTGPLDAFEREVLDYLRGLNDYDKETIRRMAYSMAEVTKLH
ncbi:helix-turn-helix transcriptional regulator [Pseudomonas sp. RIT-PI-S]|uniref:helix-turn-helix domain-containing protein n=1 Tax=Pseudomonas sp. RIT-PI-S TaxID=3035295 RepID=UPI0021D8A4FB|nr:helix-turn-helix transcriptional regulator [Pseudomonas sp. RIT-PI-S]